MKSAAYWRTEMSTEKAKVEKELIDLEYSERQRQEVFAKRRQELKELIARYEDLLAMLGEED